MNSVDAADDDEDRDDEPEFGGENPREHADEPSRLARGGLGALLEFLRAAAQDLHEIVDAARNPARKIAGAKTRQDRVLDDQLRYRVGQRAFEAVADLDPHLSLGRRNDQQCAVVDALLADPPVASKLIAEIL